MAVAPNNPNLGNPNPTPVINTSSAVKTTAAAKPTSATSSDQFVKDFIAQNFPAYSWVVAIPDLLNVFKTAIDPSGTPNKSADQLLAQLQATPWWIGHGQAYRQYLALEKSDPGTLAEQVRQKDAEVHQLANSMGLSDAALNIDNVARDAIKFGWGNAELQEQLAGLAKYNAAAPNSSHIGTIDNSMLALKQQAQKYHVDLDDATAFQWGREVAAGHHSVQDFTPIMAEWAKGKFPSLAQYIDKGMTPDNFIQPMQQTTARLLELSSPDQVDFNDPKFSRMLDYADPKTGERRLMTQAEQQSYIRSTDQWGKTKQGQTAAADMTEGLLSMFGKTPTSAGSLSGPSNAF